LSSHCFLFPFAKTHRFDVFAPPFFSSPVARSRLHLATACSFFFLTGVDEAFPCGFSLRSAALFFQYRITSARGSQWILFNHIKRRTVARPCSSKSSCFLRLCHGQCPRFPLFYLTQQSASFLLVSSSATSFCVACPFSYLMLTQTGSNFSFSTSPVNKSYPARPFSVHHRAGT